MTIPNGVSIIICTYNGLSRLEPTLKSIFSLQIDDSIPWELLIIDNGSTDNTSRFCLDSIAKNSFEHKSRVILEPMVGCNHSRRRGLNEAKYKWLLFCDDDNHLFPDYIQKAWPILQSNSKIGALGGQGIALFEGNKPAWFDRYSKSFAVGPQGGLDGKLGVKNRKLYSAGSFFRKENLMSYYDNGFEPIMEGPKGNELTRGEDTEWCIMIELIGYELWYLNSLKFYHFMTEGRMNWKYYLRLKDGIASGTAKFAPYTPFFKKQTPNYISFFATYSSNYIFFHLVWLHFLVRSKIQPSRYSQEQLQLGKVINRRKALSYRSNFRESFLHFKQLKQVLKVLKIN